MTYSEFFFNFCNPLRGLTAGSCSQEKLKVTPDNPFGQGKSKTCQEDLSTLKNDVELKL